MAPFVIERAELYLLQEFSNRSLFTSQHSVLSTQSSALFFRRLTETFEFLLKRGKSSYRRKPVSSLFKTFWTPAFAGVTNKGVVQRSRDSPWQP